MFWKLWYYVLVLTGDLLSVLYERLAVGGWISRLLFAAATRCYDAARRTCER